MGFKNLKKKIKKIRVFFIFAPLFRHGQNFLIPGRAMHIKSTSQADIPM